MGLGKTAQIISFLGYLYSSKGIGPHLIIVPSSTIDNWLREFKKWCPSLEVRSYYGSQTERAILRLQLEDDANQYGFIVTT